MAGTINKYLRKRYKRYFFAVKENTLLCETCFAQEQRRVVRNKGSLSQPPRLGNRYNYTIPQSECDDIQQIFAKF